MKQGVFVLIIVFLNSCNNTEQAVDEAKTNSDILVKVDSILIAQNFKRETKYEPLSLNLNGKPILRPGQKIETLDSTFSYSWDVNGAYWNQSNLIKDHLSMDTELSIDLDLGSINGIFFFSSDQIENQIFNIQGSWLIDTEVTSKNENEIIEKISDILFPCLIDKIKFDENWKYSIKKANYVEQFELNSPKENEGLQWSLSYQVIMN